MFSLGVVLELKKTSVVCTLYAKQTKKRFGYFQDENPGLAFQILGHKLDIFFTLQETHVSITARVVEQWGRVTSAWYVILS